MDDYLQERPVPPLQGWEQDSFLASQGPETCVVHQPNYKNLSTEQVEISIPVKGSVFSRIGTPQPAHPGPMPQLSLLLILEVDGKNITELTEAVELLYTQSVKDESEDTRTTALEEVDSSSDP